MSGKTACKGNPWITAGLIVGTVLALGASGVFAAPLCGEGSAPDYGFSYDLQQAHWTVGWQGYASEEAVVEVDTVLDPLNADSIAQTMILIKPQSEVGNRVNCAVHFLRYMQLGLPSGERKDNGFVFLIVVEPEGIDVHYGVGLGLPALTAPELTALNRAAEAAYESTQSIDQALLTLVLGFDQVARDNYAPLLLATPTPQAEDMPLQPAGPLSVLAICMQLCFGIFFVLFFMWFLIQMGRIRGSQSPYYPYNPYDPDGSGSTRGAGFPPIRGRGSGFPTMGGGQRSSPPTRGGSGSGRSGRGN